MKYVLRKSLNKWDKEYIQADGTWGPLWAAIRFNRMEEAYSFGKTHYTSSKPWKPSNINCVQDR